MISTLENTTASQIGAKLRDLREEDGLISLNRVATLVIVTHTGSLDEPIQAAVRASQEHPARIIVIVTEHDSDRDALDAEIRVGTDAGAGEVIILRAHGRVNAGLDTLITPLLLPDAPIVTWWPYTPPASPSQDPLGAIAQRRITDVYQCESPKSSLLRLARGYKSGDSDLSWSRITNWRGLVATAYDYPPAGTPKAITIEGLENNPSSLLMQAWLQRSLGEDVPVELKVVKADHGLSAVTLHRDDGDIRLMRSSEEGITMSLPGNNDDQFVTMPKRTMYDLLSEELRRLDPDDVYGDVLAAAFPLTGDPNSFAVGKPESSNVVSDDMDAVVKAVAKDAVARIAAAIEERGIAHLVLTGGRAGTATAERIAISLEFAEVDTSKLHVWWGDERFVATKSSDRNDRPVISALTTGAGIPVYNVHTIPGSDAGMSLNEAAAWYGQQLTIQGSDSAFTTQGEAYFDVLLLGVGPDGHVASLFPEHRDARATSAYAVPVRNSPKPPSERISLSWPVLNSARHVSFLVAGFDKAQAVKTAHGKVDAAACPASAVRGTESTTWFLDKEAAHFL